MQFYPRCLRKQIKQIYLAEHKAQLKQLKQLRVNQEGLFEILLISSYLFPQKCNVHF